MRLLEAWFGATGHPQDSVVFYVTSIFSIWSFYKGQLKDLESGEDMKSGWESMFSF